MKNEKKESVLIAKQYSTDELTLYDKTSNSKKIFTSNSSHSFTPDSVNQYHHHSYDLNNIDIDLNIRTSSIDDASDENTALEYGSSGSEHFQPLNTHQYDDFDCNYAKTTSEIHAVSNMLISMFSHFYCFFLFLTLTSILSRIV